MALSPSYLRALAVVSLMVLAACGQVEPQDKNDASAKQTASHPRSNLTREQVIEARSKFKVEVITYNASQPIGAEPPFADYMRLRITNGSTVTLPSLTVLTTRLDSNGRLIGSTRSPAIDTSTIKPGQIAELDYFPTDHLTGVKTLAVEIETAIPPEKEQLFAELPK